MRLSSFLELLLRVLPGKMQLVLGFSPLLLVKERRCFMKDPALLKYSEPKLSYSNKSSFNLLSVLKTFRSFHPFCMFLMRAKFSAVTSVDSTG